MGIDGGWGVKLISLCFGMVATVANNKLSDRSNCISCSTLTSISLISGFTPPSFTTICTPAPVSPCAHTGWTLTNSYTHDCALYAHSDWVLPGSRKVRNNVGYRYHTLVPIAGD